MKQIMAGAQRGEARMVRDGGCRRGDLWKPSCEASTGRQIGSQAIRISASARARKMLLTGCL